MFLFVSLAASAATQIGSLYYTLNSSNKTAEVVKSSGTQYSGSISIPSSVTYSGSTYTVTSVGSSAFSYCSGLTSVTIPNSVTSIGSYAFNDCSGLKKAEFSSLESLCTISYGNFLSNPLHYAHHLYVGGKEVSDLIIPSSVTSIKDYAFEGCSGLTSLTIPSSVTSIGEWAFLGCSGLTSLIIPSSVTSIKDYAFGNCSNLQNVYLCWNQPLKISSYVFNNTPINSATLYVPHGTFAKYTTADVWKKFRNITEYGDAINVGNVITYEATSKLNETNQITAGLHTSAFGGAHIRSHTFSNGTGIITFDTDITEIGYRAFFYCTSLTSITIPSSVTNIGEEAFDGCSGLTSISIPSAVTNIGYNAFEYCYGLTKAEFGSIESLCTISFVGYTANPLSYAKHLFINGKEVTNLVIPTTVTTIGENAFYGCSGLTSVAIPSSVTSIKYFAFRGCSGLKKVEFSSLESLISITYSGDSSNPLYYAKNLYLNGKEAKEIFIPKSITSIKRYAFSGYGGIAAVPMSLKSMAISAGISDNKLFVYDDFTSNLTSYIKGFECFEPTPNPDLIFTDLKPYITYKNIKFFLSDGNELPYAKNENGAYLVKGLPAGSNNRIKVTYTDGKGDNQSCEFSITTKAPEFSITTSVTQSTVTVKTVTAETDLTCTPTNPGIEYNYDKHNNLPAIINGLCPEQSVKLYPFAYYDGELYRGSYKEVKTSEVAPTVSSKGNITASSLEISGYYTKGDATITDEQFEVNGKVYKGNKIIATGLDPNTRYSVSYSLKANGKQYSGTRVFTTAALSMKTMQPKVISAGNVIVAAEANLDEAETNVGFEWRRTDWTDDFASNTGGAYMYSGQMEGYIRNLYTEKLWKYRPYYLSDNGMYYYGDWMGVDPTNTSYFEATVHTYSTIKIEGNTALVKGYALRGTDDIKVQGFVYWKRVSNAKTNNGRMLATSLPVDAKTVEASGQIMTATLSNLDYDSEYSYMAFVTTTEGETFYGEEQTFSIGSDITGIEPIYDNGDDSLYSSEVVGYYDLNGRRILEPQRGVNIVRYANGTSRKLFKK